ncbi:serine protease SohB [Kushneria sinocarnis]|uniref:Serine protease SohB n=1 Tax=Kushneria sinocarnis TaxID=595502 RepID=A0A420WYL9_9GAMM|nr:protease SohB [Kushneria sinocarnis]RKR06241.1 serine protease SohB [Kushneria sinocarnis]
MGDWLYEYGMFLAEVATLVVAIAAIAAIIVRARSHGGARQGTNLQVRDRRAHLRRHRETLEDARLSRAQRLRRQKQRRKQVRRERRDRSNDQRNTLWVLDFHGDLKASRIPSLTEEISAILLAAESGDEVMIRLESGGGLVHSYGLASAQLDRLREAGLGLTICVDRVAASGGYMMACCADHLIAAPFAVIGSIGVVAQVPNVHRLLKRNDIDVDVLTAGRYKRTLTVLGENTEEGRARFLEDLRETHDLFKSWVSEHRPALDIEQVADGDIWFGTQALETGLIDEVNTSEAWLQSHGDELRILEVSLRSKRSVMQRLGQTAGSAIERGVDRAIERVTASRWDRQ